MLFWFACTQVPLPATEAPGLAYEDDVQAFLEDEDYRRNILFSDLTTLDNRYAERRLTSLAGWATLPVRDVPSHELTLAHTAELRDGAPLEFDATKATPLTPDTRPTTDEAWAALGERVFFEYPLRIEDGVMALLTHPDGPASVGFLEEDGAWVGMRVFEENGEPQVGITCSRCHASHVDGVLTGQRSNRDMDIGLATILQGEHGPGELDSTQRELLTSLGPGRSDVLADGDFNPYAFPDFAGIADLPYLHHNANWVHRTPSTLALRCETLFITSSRERTRIPRVLAYAVAKWMHSLPPLEPLETSSALSETGEQVFADAGCEGCHTPPLYTSDRWVRVEEIGTDPSAAVGPVRRSGAYRIPSLRGVSRAAPYLHHGAFDTLEEMFDPARDEPGHRPGLDLSEPDRSALIAFLRTL